MPSDSPSTDHNISAPARASRISRLRLRKDEIFAADHLAHDLAGRTVRGGVATVISQVSALVLQTVSIIVLARILTPQDYGIIGMVTVIIGLAQIFKDGGLGMGTIQSETISHEQISSVFWVNVALLLTVGAIVLGASPLIAAFFRRPELIPVTIVLGIAFVINGLSVQHDALLRRHMKFVAVAITVVVPLFLSIVVSIVLALLGWHYWALVAATVVIAVMSTGLSFWLCGWVPGGFHRGAGAGKLVRFGRDLTLFNAFNYFARNADNILIGKFLGAAPLGLYAKAYSLFLLPMTQIRSPLSDVSMPALSSLKNQPERYARYYHNFLGALAFATVPISAYCALEGDFVIATLLGPKWAGAALTFRILAAAGILQTIASTRGLVLVSLGESKKYLWLGIINGVAMVISFVIGLKWGIVGVASAYTIANLIVLVPTAVFTFKGTPVTLGQFFSVLVKPIAFAAAGALAASVILWFGGRVVPGAFLLHLIAFVAFWGLYALLAWRDSDFQDTWQAFSGRLFGKRAAAPAVIE